MSKFNLTKEMYRKYPNDYRVIDKYISELFNDPNYPDEPLGEEVHKDEIFKLCENVLENCTIQKIRYYAMSILSKLYINDGLIDKAKEMCEQFPEACTILFRSNTRTYMADVMTTSTLSSQKRIYGIPQFIL